MIVLDDISKRAAKRMKALSRIEGLYPLIPVSNKASWWEVRLAKLFGTKKVFRLHCWTVTIHRWRGKNYVTDCAYNYWEEEQ